MKKLIAAAAAVALTFAMTVSAFAAPSQNASTQDGAVDIVSAANADKAFADSESKIVASLRGMGFVIGKDAYNTHFSIVGKYEVTRKDGKTDVPAYVTFDLPDLKGEYANYSYVALHLNRNNVWEILPMTKVADGRYQIYMTSFSPVYIARVFNPNNVKTTTAAGTSPKTGDAGAVAVIVNALA